MHARQNGCSQLRSPNLRSPGDGLLMTFSRQMAHSRSATAGCFFRRSSRAVHAEVCACASSSESGCSACFPHTWNPASSPHVEHKHHSTVILRFVLLRMYSSTNVPHYFLLHSFSWQFLSKKPRPSALQERIKTTKNCVCFNLALETFPLIHFFRSIGGSPASAPSLPPSPIPAPVSLSLSLQKNSNTCVWRNSERCAHQCTHRNLRTQPHTPAPSPGGPCHLNVILPTAGKVKQGDGGHCKRLLKHAGKPSIMGTGQSGPDRIVENRLPHSSRTYNSRVKPRQKGPRARLKAYVKSKSLDNVHSTNTASIPVSFKLP